MNCPSCHVKLESAERLGVEVDRCPRCRGLWVTHENLDLIIHRSDSPGARFKTPDGDDADGESWSRDAEERHTPRKRRSFLSELLDFG